MFPPARVLAICGSDPAAAGLKRVLARQELNVGRAESLHDALLGLPLTDVQVVLVDCTASLAGDAAAFGQLLDAIDARGIACLLLGRPAVSADRLSSNVQLVDPRITADELFGRIVTIQHYHRLVQQTQLEVHHMQRMGRHLDRQFAEVDQDMRLAARLQQEFLPKGLPEVEGLRFSVLYRPASWVSGDVYDIVRVDESHICLYVADAVGHGMAASLLTMFVRQAMHSKEIRGTDYRILSPSETLSRLNDVMADEKLNNSQYVTVSYCLLNHDTLTLSCARGGHPYLIIADHDGGLTEIRSDGGLIGLFHGQEFATQHVPLKPGQKLIVYSDGLELALVDSRDPDTGQPRYKREFQKLARLPGPQMVQRLEQMMDDEEGSLNPGDDVTVIVMEVIA